MKRNMDLIRLLLLSYEGDQEAQQKIEGIYLVMETGVFVAPRIPGLPPLQVPGGPTNLSEILEMRRREGRLT